MKKFFIILFFGFLVWVVPFGVSAIGVSLQQSNPELFVTIKFLSLIISTVFFLVIYFRKIFTGFAAEGFLVGIIWLAYACSWIGFLLMGKAILGNIF